MSAPNSPPPTPKRRWLQRTAIAGVALVGVAAIAYWGVSWYASSMARSQIAEQIEAAVGGNVEMDDVSVGLDGVTARNIRIIGADGEEPWAKLKEFRIDAPISELISSDPKFTQLTASDAEITLDLDDEGNLQLEFPESDEAFALPAKRIEVRNARLTIRQPDRSDFIAQGVNLTLVESADGVVIEGEIQKLADADWQLAGNYNPEANTYNFKASTKRVDLDSKLIAKWPLTPPGVLDEVEVKGPVAASLDLRSDGPEMTNYEVALTPLGAKVRLPSIDLALQATGGRLDFTDGKLRVIDLETEFAEGTALLNGAVDFSNSPIEGHFTGDMTEVGAAVVAKLAMLPPEITGNVSGKASGTVTVEDDLSFSLSLQATGTSNNGKYLGFPLTDPDIKVDIKTLRFDNQVALQEMAGSATVDTSVAEVAVNEFLDRFQLKAAGDSPVIAGNADAKVQLAIPLATVEQIGTWDLKVDAVANKLSIAGESLSNVKAGLKIVDGALQIQPSTGQALDRFGNLSEIAFQGAVPLDDKPLAKFEIEGNSIAVEWLLGIAKDFSPDVDQVLKMIDKQYDGDKSSVAGNLTVNAKLEFPPAASEDFSQWRIEGEVTTGNLIVDDREIKNLKSNFLLDDSVLTIERLSGDLDKGGSISIKGTVPLQQAKPAAVDVSLNNTSLSWLVGIASAASPEVASALKQVEIDIANRPNDLAGDVTIAARIARAESTDETAKPWIVSAQANSESLTIKDQPIRNLAAALDINKDRLLIEKFAFATPADGTVETKVVWPLSEEAGVGEIDIQWNQVALDFLAQLAGAGELDARGNASGTLQIERRLAKGKPPAWSVIGDLRASDASLYEVPLGSLSAEIVTNDDVVMIQNVALGESKDLMLTAQLQTAPPYAFAANADIKQLDLAKVFHGQKAFFDVPKIVGRLSLIAQAKGALDPFTIATSGDAKLDQLEVDNHKFDDVSAHWKDLGNDPKKGEAVLQIVGGVIELDEWSRAPESISVAIRDLDAEQLTSVGDLPVSLTGRLSGSALIESWSDPVARHANLTLEGATTKFGPFQVGKLRGDVDLLNNRLEYQIVGSVLDGNLIAKGETVIPDEGLETLRLPIAVQLTETNLNRIHTISSRTTGLRELFGVVAVDLDLVAQGPDFSPEGTGRVRVRNISYKGKEFISGGETDIVLQDGMLSSRRFQLNVGGGDVSGSIRYPLSGSQPGSYEISFRRIRLATLDAFDLDLEQRTAGTLDARFAGALGPVVTGSGQLAVSRANVLGLDGESFRLPVQYRVDLGTLSGAAEIRRTQLSLLHGSVYLKGDLHWGSRLDFNLDAQISNIDSRRLVAALSGSQVYDQGKLNGKLLLKGRAVRSMRDLRGSFKGSLERSQALSLPILDDLASFINAGQLTQSEFDTGDIDLTLANGIVTVNNIGFASSAAKILINGKVTLEGRLDLNVVALIENLNTNQAFLALSQTPLTRYSAVGLALRVTNFLSNRSIYAHVSGTANSPVFRLETARLLRDEAVRFLLSDTVFQQNLQLPVN